MYHGTLVMYHGTLVMYHGTLVMYHGICIMVDKELWLCILLYGQLDVDRFFTETSCKEIEMKNLLFYLIKISLALVLCIHTGLCEHIEKELP